ncbi:hypothetical protein ATK36_4448 [Amycolatopsis sulphurea]|uniref:Uncharacterized protein n=1 Tax=Amycolatopsis sulphurea TaxID=76022 RepID=A0A2A9FEE5_9PSEU|nr:hypothetical protein [Amycolatopsis sulphurea]PFG49303.1 hypothetical protein ATK36_4448 [Amycolatopsis sulphurea]
MNTTLTVIGASAGLMVLVLMSLAPALVDLNERFPVAPRKQSVRKQAVAAKAAITQTVSAKAQAVREQTASARVSAAAPTH